MGLPTLTPHQDDAVCDAKEWYAESSAGGVLERPDYYLAGYAGTGKSTILPAIVDGTGVHPDNIEFVAPTGKAAKVMTEKLKQAGIERRARTIHSLIYRPRPLKAEVLEKQLRALKDQRTNILQDIHESGDMSPEELVDWRRNPRLVEIDTTIAITEKDLDKAYDLSEGPKFQLNVDSDIRKAKLLVCDEASMVGSTIADDLRSFGIPILVMGDPGQLQPVGDAPGFTDRAPDFFLSEIHRQAKDNPIIALATMVREGKFLKAGKMGGGVEIVDRIRDTATYDQNREAQIIVGTNKRRWMVTSKLRKVLGYNSTGPCAGEPLLICKNSRNVPDLVNGTFVNCVHDAGFLEEGHDSFKLLIEDEFGVQRSVLAYQGMFEEHTLLKKGAATAPKNQAFRARIDSEHVDWGWAITCHKSQGSQWDDVILHDESAVFKDEWMKWLYTGVTRAAKRLTVVL